MFICLEQCADCLHTTTVILKPHLPKWFAFPLLLYHSFVLQKRPLNQCFCNRVLPYVKCVLQCIVKYLALFQCVFVPSCPCILSRGCVNIGQFVPVEVVPRLKPSTLSARPRFCSHIHRYSRKFRRASRRLILVVSCLVFIVTLSVQCLQMCHDMISEGIVIENCKIRINRTSFLENK